MHILTRRTLLLVNRRFVSPASHRQISLRSRLTTADPDHIIYGIIGVNVSVYALWNSNAVSRRFMIENFTTSLNHVKALKLHTLLTATVSHFDTSHLFFNMLGLYFMGRSVSRVLGNIKFLQLYIFGGVFASAGQLAADYMTLRNKSIFTPSKVSLGASGSVSSIVAYSILYNPTATFYIYMIVPVPAALFGVYFIGKDVVGLLNERSTVGNAAHLGGAAFGALTFLYHRRLLPRC